MSSSSKEAAPSVLKGGRTKCYAARDAFYECVEDQCDQFEGGQDVPKACATLRKAYQDSCSASWVSHFDSLKSTEMRTIQELHRNINENHSRSQGTQAGRKLN